MNSEKPFFHGEIAVGSTQAAHKISDHKYVILMRGQSYIKTCYWSAESSSVLIQIPISL